uniref:Uncharacterized protein n=1 Tax=Coccidioides posadasii RMSCC 3488 TaxID=454284 RepID=A0A0J6FV31_COCPO|nr:hypothetical protein CPAG_09579 [Coccidioides posadasii RMSCC 3488]
MPGNRPLRGKSGGTPRVGRQRTLPFTTAIRTSRWATSGMVVRANGRPGGTHIVPYHQATPWSYCTSIHPFCALQQRFQHGINVGKGPESRSSTPCERHCSPFHPEEILCTYHAAGFSFLGSAETRLVSNRRPTTLRTCSWAGGDAEVAARCGSHAG